MQPRKEESIEHAVTRSSNSDSNNKPHANHTRDNNDVMIVTKYCNIHAQRKPSTLIPKQRHYCKCGWAASPCSRPLMCQANRSPFVQTPVEHYISKQSLITR